MTNYHIKRDKNGTPTGKGVCIAEKSCPNGGFHSTDKAELDKTIEKELSQTYSTIQPLAKKGKKAREPKIVEGVYKNYMPTGILSPAKIDDNGNEVRPALTFEKYYAGTNKKHFLDKSKASSEETEKFLNNPGSQYNPEEVSSISDLVDITAAKREGGLNGDDRDKLVELGADPEGFSDKYRYLIAPVSGKLGSITSEGLSDDTPISFYEKSPGSNSISLTIEKENKPDVDFGVLIMTKRSNVMPGDFGDEEVVVTSHPGLPSKVNPARDKLSREEKAKYDEEYHQSLRQLQKENRLTIGEVKKLKGNRDFNLNVKIS